MASTSTNKQPLLVDRPLHEFVVLGAAAALTSASNLSSILAGGCVTLVDCSDLDGAVIDSVSAVATEANMTATRVLLFLSAAATIFGITETNTACVASAELTSQSVGQRTNLSLPPLSIPVPNLGGMSAPGETDKKGTGLYIPAGFVLYAGLSTPVLAPTPISKVNVFAQGGYF